MAPWLDRTDTEKTLIPNEFVRVTGYHRKRVLRVQRVLRMRPADRRPRAVSRPCVYDEAVRQALVVLWEATHRTSGKRLRPFLPLLIDLLERHGHIDLDGEVRSKLLRASASTIDRLLAPARAAAPRKRRYRRSAVRGQMCPTSGSGGLAGVLRDHHSGEGTDGDFSAAPPARRAGGQASPAPGR